MTQNTGNASEIDEFAQVFGAERSGRVRCVGLGPTPSTYFKNHGFSKTNEAEVIGLRNRVHDLEGKLEKMNELEAKLEKMNDLEDKLEKMNDVLNRLASSDWN